MKRRKNFDKSIVHSWLEKLYKIDHREFKIQKHDDIINKIKSNIFQFEKNIFDCLTLRQMKR